MAAATIPTRFEQALIDLQLASADSQLWLLRQLTRQLSDAIASAPPAALFSQTVQRLIQQLQQVRRQDRLEVLRDIITGGDTRFSQEYHHLDSSMKLIFWYRLSAWLPQHWQQESCSQEQRDTLQRLQKSFAAMDSNQQFYYLQELLKHLDAVHLQPQMV